MTIPICPCGLPKTMVGTIAVCQGHCDTYCPNPHSCQRCRHYSLTVNQRVTAEHVREKANG